MKNRVACFMRGRPLQHPAGLRWVCLSWHMRAWRLRAPCTGNTRAGCVRARQTFGTGRSIVHAWCQQSAQAHRLSGQTAADHAVPPPMPPCSRPAQPAPTTLPTAPPAIAAPPAAALAAAAQAATTAAAPATTQPATTAATTPAATAAPASATPASAPSPPSPTAAPRGASTQSAAAGKGSSESHLAGVLRGWSVSLVSLVCKHLPTTLRLLE